MSLACNIDARGKAVRLGIGIVLLALGFAFVWLWALPAKTASAWFVSTGLLLAGAFSVFEARAGWCALRAMGFRTKI